MRRKPPRSSDLDHDSPESADGLATLDDLAHAKNCLALLTSGGFTGDELVRRALYQSALISYRRSVGSESRSMRRDSKGGGVAVKITNDDLPWILKEAELVETARRMYELADNHVAHRQPIEGLRWVNASLGDTGNPTLEGVWNLPDDLGDFKRVAEALYLYIFERTATAMSGNSDRCIANYSD